MVRSSVMARLSIAAILVVPTLLFAEIYDKREIKPWFSLGGQANFQQTEGINAALFEAHSDYDNVVLPFYSRFDEWVPPLYAGEVGMGVEYGQLMVGFFTNFTFPATSKRPAAKATIPYIIGSGSGADTILVDLDYQDAQFYLIGLDFAFGWMLAAPDAPVNLIPSIRFGFSILNLRWPADYPYYSDDGKVDDYKVGKSYYSTAGRSVTPELELRLRLSQHTRLGLYGGYRYTLIDHVIITKLGGEEYFHKNTYNDIDASNFFAGLRFTVVLRSAKEKARDFAKE